MNRLHAATILALAACSTAAAAAPRFQLLHVFAGTDDGSWPAGNFIADKTGTLYGTTSTGGPNGAGSVYRLAPDGTLTTLYNFTGGHDGDLPLSGLRTDADGNLFGVTEVGGKNGAGNVYEVTKAGVATSIYDFGATNTDGFNPICQLIWGPHRTLMGTTLNGGKHGFGTVFTVTLDGKRTILHDFNGQEGRYPPGGLVMDAAGNVYGTTFNSGAGSSGTVYKIDTHGTFSTIHVFADKYGYFPHGALTLDKSGTLYGTTSAGGAHGDGTVFSLSTTGTNYKLLYSFTGKADGATPLEAPFIDQAGNLLSTTQGGGVGDNGTIFSLSPTGVLTTLYSFTGTATGTHSQAGLVLDPGRGFSWLYGTTYAGGPSGNGVIFRIHQ